MNLDLNEVSDISALGNCVEMKNLGLEHNLIADIGILTNVLSNMPKLEEIRIGGNNLSDGDIDMLRDTFQNVKIIEVSGGESN